MNKQMQMKKIVLAVAIACAAPLAFAGGSYSSGNNGSYTNSHTGTVNWNSGNSTNYNVGSSITNAGSQVSGTFQAAGNYGMANGTSTASNFTVGGSIAGSGTGYGVPLAGSLAADYSVSTGSGSFNSKGANSYADGTYGAGGSLSTYASMTGGNYENNSGTASWNHSFNDNWSHSFDVHWHH